VKPFCSSMKTAMVCCLNKNSSKDYRNLARIVSLLMKLKWFLSTLTLINKVRLAVSSLKTLSMKRGHQRISVNCLNDFLID
jgi:hypothetical protein